MRTDAAAVASARAVGEVCAERATNRALRSDPLFTVKAREFIVKYLAANGETSGENLTNFAKLAGIRPTDDRAFGGVYAKLLKDGAVKVTGITQRFKGHGSAGAKCYALGDKLQAEVTNARQHVRALFDPLWKDAAEAYGGFASAHIKGIARDRARQWLAAAILMNRLTADRINTFTLQMEQDVAAARMCS